MIYCLRPIGVVHVPFNDEVVKESRNGVAGVLEIFQDFSDGLRGIDGFSHLIVVSYLHKTLEEWRTTLLVRPRKLIRLGFQLDEIPEVGVFCTDSPHRPNPIGITIVKFVKRDGRFLYVDGLDLFDGTPIIDLRPYTMDRVRTNLEFPEWYTKVLARIKEWLGGSEDVGLGV
ncbi:MAG: tRNA (N6-threonylcarbamoyladenosine(37)-N6)-methyltransferase TrmO [Sulfolobales archaeon]